MIQIKRGETFNLDGQHLEDDGITPKSLVGITITSQVRDQSGRLVADLTVTVTDSNTGKFSVSANTTTWTEGNLVWDVKKTTGSIVEISNTETIRVLRAVTQ